MMNRTNPKGTRGRPARSGVRYGWRKRALLAARWEYVRKQRLFQAALEKHDIAPLLDQVVAEAEAGA